MSLTRAATLSGSVQDLIENGPAGAPTVPWILQPSGELAKAMNFLAASSLAPSVVLGMYRAFGIQIVTRVSAASCAGSGKNPTSLMLSGLFCRMDERALVSIG